MSPAPHRDIPLSVVIATRGSWAEHRPLLELLLERVRSVGGELVVASGSADTVSPPSPVRWVAVGDDDMFRLRLVGLRAARGAVVALGEDHAVPRPDWCHAILRAHVENPDAQGDTYNPIDPATLPAYRSARRRPWTITGASECPRRRTSPSRWLVGGEVATRSTSSPSSSNRVSIRIPRRSSLGRHDRDRGN